MTIDEAIILYEGMAEENQKIVDTHIIPFIDCDGEDTGVSIDEIYCDDTEIIEERLAGYKKNAEDCRQFARWLKELKTLREQQPCTCEDAVSRKAVFEVIDDCHRDGFMSVFCSYKDGERFKDYIKELPSVIPKSVTVTDFADKCRECGKQNKWIPVSERLPEECETVLGTTRYNNLYKTDWWDDCGEIKWNTRDSTDTPIVAWMPLPEPYETEQEVEE